MKIHKTERCLPKYPSSLLKLFFQNSHFYVCAYGFAIILSEQWSKIQLPYGTQKASKEYKKVFILDRHVQNRKWIKEELPETKHYFEWYVAKGTLLYQSYDKITS